MTSVRKPFWWESVENGGKPTRPALINDDSFDVVIVGAGYTGLWTAYYLARSAPQLSIAVLEAHYVGYGASGRNGGWLSASVPGSKERLASENGRVATLELIGAMKDALGEVLAVAENEGIEMDAQHSGCLRIATTPSQARRLSDAIANEQLWETGTQGWRLKSAEEVSERIRVPGVLLGAYTPHCARIQPAKLVAGLAGVVERLGVQIFEMTPVIEISANVVTTKMGRVNARHVLRATEGFTCRLSGESRHWLPMNSSMIATEPLDEQTWSEIGWDNAETLSDFAHAYAYLQRTKDNRIAIGGRGIPYVYAGRFDPGGLTPESTVRALKAVLDRLFPAAVNAKVAAAWSGVLAVPRDWCAGVTYDATAGLGWAGGYSGQGVTAANLAGHTLSDLVLEKKTSRTELAWIDRKSRRWEPEPWRWLGVQAMYAAYRKADRIESSRLSPESSWIARIADRISGR